MNCKCCNKPIEQERLSVIATTVICSTCARVHNPVKKMRGILVFDHKTGGTLQTMSEQYYFDNKKYFKANGARSVVKNFSKNICS